jgi:hypothetical protein
MAGLAYYLSDIAKLAGIAFFLAAQVDPLGADAQQSPDSR